MTLVESLISIALLSAIVISVLGVFFISKTTSVHAKHRMAAMNIIRRYIEQEVMMGYDGGNDAEGDYYATVTSAGGVAVTIDDRGTADASDDLNGTITPDPYYPLNIEDGSGNQLVYSGVPYKIIGFVVNWNEDLTGGASQERGITHLSYHTAS